MAYDLYLAERIKQELESQKVNFYEKKMFGGNEFMVDDKMCIGVVKDHLMARVNPENEKQLLAKEGARPMDFTGRPMKGYVYVSPDGIDMSDDLEFWINECLNFNPVAKASKKRST